jgi:hypothetical protein
MGLDRESELQRLSEADQHIANAEAAITEQIARVHELRRDRHDAGKAEATLKVFQDTLQTLREHRALIFQTIDQIDRGLV